MTKEERLAALAQELINQLALYKKSLNNDEHFDVRKPISDRMQQIEKEMEELKKL